MYPDDDPLCLTRILQRPGPAHGAGHTSQQHGAPGPVLAAGPPLASEQRPPGLNATPAAVGASPGQPSASGHCAPHLPGHSIS